MVRGALAFGGKNVSGERGRMVRVESSFDRALRI